MCTIFNVKSVIGLSAGIVCILVGSVISQSELTIRIQGFLWRLPLGNITVALFMLLLLVVFIGFIAVKNFNFERLVKKYEA